MIFHHSSGKKMTSMESMAPRWDCGKNHRPIAARFPAWSNQTMARVSLTAATAREYGTTKRSMASFPAWPHAGLIDARKQWEAAGNKEKEKVFRESARLRQISSILKCVFIFWSFYCRINQS